MLPPAPGSNSRGNLHHIDVAIPKQRLTVFTGVSGSGKSSLVFDTIAAQSQRLINETYSAFLQGFMPRVDRPDVDILEGLTTAIIGDQERIVGNARSTVGTVTDANALLRILFSRFGRPNVIEHHQAVMAHADWIIDLGPGAGHDADRVVFEGTPADLVAARSTLTGQYLVTYAALGDRTGPDSLPLSRGGR